MSESINLYPEMNAQIASILRISGLPEHLYAAQLIESLLVRVGALEAGNKFLESELAHVAAAAVQWVTYDGTEATRPDRRCNEFNLGTVMFFTPLGGGTTMTAVMRPFAACRFPSDIDPEDIPDDFEPDEWVWQRVDKPEVVWLATIGDRWAYMPAPPDCEG